MVIKLKIGKISSKDLNERIFKNLIKNRKEVVLGPDIGVDTSVLDFGGDLIVLSTDPITGATKELGKLAVNVSCNDIACECAEPVGILITALLPESAELEDLEEIVKDASEECRKNGLEIIGGHTEVTDAVNRIILNTTVIGRLPKNSMPQKYSLSEGDAVLISKYIGIEGTSIIYNEKKEILKEYFSEDEMKELSGFSEMLSVLKESKIAGKYRVKYLHDITEGGVYGALWESAKANNVRIDVNMKEIPMHPLTEKICKIFSIDPYRLISSGSMILIMDRRDVPEYIKECERNNLKISEIGKVSLGKGAFIREEKNFYELQEPGPDELYKVF